jgi:hypothetical protein
MPDYPLEALTAATEAVARELPRNIPWVRAQCSDERTREIAFDLAEAALDAAAPLLADEVARRITAHADRIDPVRRHHIPSARRRAFAIAARIAEGAFTTEAESKRQIAQALNDIYERSKDDGHA